MKAYSVDLRTRVVAAVHGGMPYPEAARLFQISVGSIRRWVRQHDTTRSLAPKPRPGLARRITLAQEATLRWQLDQYPDATFAEHATRWNADHGTTLSPWTLGRAIRRLGWSRKKRR